MSEGCSLMPRTELAKHHDPVRHQQQFPNDRRTRPTDGSVVTMPCIAGWAYADVLTRLADHVPLSPSIPTAAAAWPSLGVRWRQGGSSVLHKDPVR
jgi:hypothetical protein